MVGRMSEGPVPESDDASDMQMSQSDVDQINDDIDVDEESTQQEDAEAPRAAVTAPEEDGPVDDKDVEVEEEELPEEASELEALSSSPPPERQEMEPAPQPRLKIRLKLPTQSIAQTAISTPDEAGVSSSRRDTSRDIESEDSDDGADGTQSTRSASVATSGTTGRALTARQAVLANVVDPSHVSLAARANPRKKKPLTEIEIALKREETARKRKNLSEKKLEDEKTETINRLLKKQSRAKGKRNALSTAEDKPAPLASTSNVVDADVEDGDANVPEAPVPAMYRWISTSRTGTGKGDQSSPDSQKKKMTLSFSVPVAVLTSVEDSSVASEKMDVDRDTSGTRAKERPQCDVQGCTEQRKYRLVRNWEKGACGMSHLKILEAQFG